ncbi:MAG: hypothetical protein COV33_00580 [Candidatus Zambryskibacteria bacterium CG10_big_fil_rev_8_21_14_0_10_34_34]|uniref:Glycosyltransferase family 1 protein n=1 Tax=Candidatus Zambryskibacteria bacterium CG10_big_fil_rev_8_21_14_0_10_34_34 TaxID=1975114 RepID=A0A2H0R371_9BACT|nr:MAG: hypothetical protein COV33_00580 [Candidatus Zambryskibacteria bacterium CG10_big_fil_rev_8_21_14_0_10_34_34]
MHKKKKILYVITKGNFGGAQRYVYDLATSLSKDGYDVVVACGSSVTEDIVGNKGLKERLEEKEIRVIKLASAQRNINLLRDLKTFFDIWKMIRQEKPDILHINSSKIGGLGSLAGRLTRTPRIIFTAHGWAFNEERSLTSKFFILLLHWITVILSHQTIVVSNKTKKDIFWMPFVKNKIKVIHNGIKNFEKTEKCEARQILAKNYTEKIIIYSISELHKNKGLDIGIKGIALLPEELKGKVLYCIAGMGEEKENLEKLVKELNLKKQIKFLGFLDNAKNILSGADIFLFPSRTENLPFAILEAGLSDLPIIATNVGGISEIIKDMESGILIHPKNPKEIAEALMYLLEHQDKQKEFGEEIKKTIVSFFSLEKMLNETIKLYQ